MLFVDHWQEIFQTLRRNKMRAALTGLSVAWGILMLIVLLGAGQGLQNQVESNFADDATNSIWMRPGRASLPFHGLRPGRQIKFTNADYEALKRIPGIEHVSGRFYMHGVAYTVNHGNKSASFDARSVHPGHQYLEKTIITRGRFLNDVDIEQCRKVTVIGEAVSEFFFGDADPVGEYLTIRGIQYRVVGTFIDEGGEGELQKVFLPITTAQRAYNAHDEVHHLLFTVGDASVEESRRIETAVREVLGARLHFDPSDTGALRVQNNVEEFHKIQQVFALIRAFLWIVGLGTITASVVGVSNILLISVAERTVEIGVRKALGATPFSIVSMILKESLFVTGLAGYLGLFSGVALLELFNTLLPSNDYIKNPSVDMRVALTALALLVLAGLIAGFIPARRAAKVSPVEALRSE